MLTRLVDWFLNMHLAYLGLAWITFILSFIVMSAHFEARAYNRLTGSDVTTWEAIWVRLRVDCRGNSGGPRG